MMKPYFVRERIFALLSAVSLVAVVACEDKRVKALDTGISIDSAITILSPGTARKNPIDIDSSAPNVFWQDRYLINGKNYEVLYFSPKNEKRGKDSVFKGLTPVVFVDGKMIGRGWSFWDSASKAMNIPLKKH